MAAVPGMDERQLRGAVRTLAVMVECALQPQRSEQTPAGRKLNATQAKTLARIVALIEQAAADQRRACLRTAQTQLCQSFADAFRELLIPDDAQPRPSIKPQDRHGRPMGRLLPGRIREGLGVSETVFVHDVDAALRAFEQATGVRIELSDADFDEEIELAMKRLPGDDPVSLALAWVSELLEVSESTLEGYMELRRHGKSRKMQPRHGDLGLYFGAELPPTSREVLRNLAPDMAAEGEPPEYDAAFVAADALTAREAAAVAVNKGATLGGAREGGADYDKLREAAAALRAALETDPPTGRERLDALGLPQLWLNDARGGRGAG